VALQLRAQKLAEERDAAVLPCPPSHDRLLFYPPRLPNPPALHSLLPRHEHTRPPISAATAPFLSELRSLQNTDMLTVMR